MTTAEKELEELENLHETKDLNSMQLFRLEELRIIVRAQQQKNHTRHQAERLALSELKAWARRTPYYAAWSVVYDGGRVAFMLVSPTEFVEARRFVPTFEVASREPEVVFERATYDEALGAAADYCRKQRLAQSAQPCVCYKLPRRKRKCERCLAVETYDP